jgi:ceramide glucosyltransferase
MIVNLLILLTVLGWIYWVVAYGLLKSFFSNARNITDPNYEPPISILKPVKGLDDEVYENFKSYCLQDYPQFEILFGVADHDDPVIPVIERLQRDFPRCDIRLIVQAVKGANRKASMLHVLAKQAQYSILVTSDSDMRVTPDYLHRVVAPMTDPQVGLVTCLYKPLRATTLTARLEALHMGVTFLPSVMVARKFLDMRFAMGATEVMRKDDLAMLGGFTAIADYLADDYQLGARMAANGKRVVLSDYIVVCVIGSTTFREQWQREVRWSLCSRISRPLEFPGLLLSFSTPLSSLMVLFSGLAEWGWMSLVTSVVLRWTVGYLVTLETDDPISRRWLFWLPVRDFLSAIVWCVGLFGKRVMWRGEQFTLRADGRLTPQSVADQEAKADLLSRLVRTIDQMLRNYYGIYEFSQDERCLMRLSIGNARKDVQLSDGIFVQAGDLVLELHLWNEHIPSMSADGADLAWALSFQRRLTLTMKLLAGYLETTPALEEVQALSGDPPFGNRVGAIDLRELVQRWGFEVIPGPPSEGLWANFLEFWVNLYAFGLLWAYNPASIKKKGFDGIKRDELWMSRQTLLEKYGEKEPSSRVIQPAPVRRPAQKMKPLRRDSGG